MSSRCLALTPPLSSARSSQRLNTQGIGKYKLRRITWQPCLRTFFDTIQLSEGMALHLPLKALGMLLGCSSTRPWHGGALAVLGVGGTESRTSKAVMAYPWRRVIGIAGGMGPHAHIEASNAASCTDFAVLTCITAHAFLDEIRTQVRLPILDIVELTLVEAARRFGFGARTGILATTGALRGRVYRRTASRVTSSLDMVSLLDLPEGNALQEELVMRPIYGPLREGRRQPRGIKCGGDCDLETRI